MTAQELHRQLNTGRINKPDVDRLVAHVLASPELVGPLFKEVGIHDKEDNFAASWTFDHVMRKKLELIVPILNDFIEGLDQVQSESSIRPMAHICQLLTQAYYKAKRPLFRNALSLSYLETMATVCFDWLIEEHKVATKVFAMTSLFYLGETFDWIRPELKSVLEQHLPQGSAGFQNRGIKILNELKKLGY